MVAARGRLVDRVVSRLAPAGDGDILVPQRGLFIVGATQRLAAGPENLRPEPGEIPFLLRRAAELAPAFASSPIHAAWSAARPLAGRPEPGGDGRSISRDFAVLDHAARDGVEGLVTLIGGKATTMRAMAERTADLVCRKTGFGAPCRTRETALLPYRGFWK